MKTKLALPSLAAIFLLTAPASMGAVMYHDFGASTAGEVSTGNITTHQIGTSSAEAADTSTKNLIDYATGTATGATFAVAGAFAMDGRDSGQFAAPTGGDADTLFNVAGLNLTNGALYEQNGTMTLTLAGLNSSLTYDLALYGNRTLAADGAERFTLAGADSATNSSSTGIVSTFVTDMETRPNTSSVIRWTAINPGIDGTITVSVDPGVTDEFNLAYLSAIRLESIPEPSAAALLGLSALALLRRRRK